MKTFFSLSSHEASSQNREIVTFAIIIRSEINIRFEKIFNWIARKIYFSSRALACFVRVGIPQLA